MTPTARTARSRSRRISSPITQGPAPLYSSSLSSAEYLEQTLSEELTEKGRRLWTPFRYHPVQSALWSSNARFRMVPAGRRSGKTAIAKRFGVLSAVTCTLPDGWFVFAAPVQKQAVQIYWRDLKAMIPKSWQLRRPSESDRTIFLINGAEIQVIGLDVPERLEGRPLDGIVIDEYGNCREEAWDANIRPALSTPDRPPGWAWLIGVPEGRNHYYDLWQDVISTPDDEEWAGFTWSSRDIMDPKEVESLRKKLDPKTFSQEVDATFESFDGAVYYGFERKVHAGTRLRYRPTEPLYITFDFNVEPGTANIVQEGPPTQGSLPQSVFQKFSASVTQVIDEIHVPVGSSTPRVCHDILAKYRNHKGPVVMIGDPSGGNRETSQTAGTDIDLIKQIFRPVFGERLRNAFSLSKVPVKARINSVNARIQSTDEKYHFQIDPMTCPHTVKDFEGVMVLKGTAGIPDKRKCEKEGIGHHTDGIGYYIHRKFPLRRPTALLQSA